MRKISGEEFGSLYASLETLDANQIIAAFLSIPILRQGVKASLYHYTTSDPEDLSVSQDISDSMMPHVKRPRKNRSPIKLVSKLGASLESDEEMDWSVPMQATNSKLLGGDVSDIEKLSTLGDQHFIMAPGSLHQQPLPAAYLEWCRLASSQLAYNYQYQMYLRYQSLYTGLATAHTHQPEATQEDRKPENVKEDYHSPSPGIQEPEDLSLKKTSPSSPTAASSSGRSSSYMVREEITSALRDEIKEKATSPGITMVTCPDCKTNIPLISLHAHMREHCNQNAMSSEDGDSIDAPQEPGRVSITRRTPSRAKLGLSNNTFSCTECHLTFRNKSSLKRHKISHSAGGGYPCQFCGKLFGKPELLKRHETLHTETSRTLWPCSFCGKGFSNKYNLAVHERIHTGELPFSCQFCDERFRVKCSMQNHMRSRHRARISSSGEDTIERLSLPSPVSSVEASS